MGPYRFAASAAGRDIQMGNFINQDASVNPGTLVSLGTLLLTMEANASRTAWFVQNQDVTLMSVVLDGGALAARNASVYALSVASVLGGAGGGLITGFPHAGRIRVYGTAGARCAAAQW